MMENEEERMMKRVEMTMKAFPELQKDYLHLRKPLSHKRKKKNHKNPYPTVKLQTKNILKLIKEVRLPEIRLTADFAEATVHNTR